MINMAMSPEEKAEYAQPSIMNDSPDYPYGLCITIDNESLEKLGIPIPEAGSFVMIQARAKVMNVNQRPDDDDDGSPETTIQLQITDMEVGPDSGAKSTAEKLYGG